MHPSFEAIVKPNGTIELQEPIKVNVPYKAIVTLLDVCENEAPGVSPPPSEIRGSVKGIWKGSLIDDSLYEESKKSLFPYEKN